MIYKSITNFMRLHWSDEKLAQAYAFNQDGHMNPRCARSCLLSVTGHRVVGQWVSGDYAKVRWTFIGAQAAERAYLLMPFPKTILGWLMKREIARRDRWRKSQRLASEKTETRVEVTQ